MGSAKFLGHHIGYGSDITGGSENVWACYLFILVLPPLITLAILTSRSGYNHKTVLLYMLLSVIITILILVLKHKTIMREVFHQKEDIK